MQRVAAGQRGSSAVQRGARGCEQGHDAERCSRGDRAQRPVSRNTWSCTDFKTSTMANSINLLLNQLHYDPEDS